MRLDFELPYPPSINHYWRRVGSYTIISREGRRFREYVVAILTAHRISPLEGPLKIEIMVHPPDNRRRDIDNLLKSTLDALQHGGAYKDDSQITELYVKKCSVVPKGKVRIVLIEEGHEGD